LTFGISTKSAFEASKFYILGALGYG